MFEEDDPTTRNRRFELAPDQDLGYRAAEKPSEVELSQLRNEAQQVPVERFALRSCWECNSSHRHFLQDEQDWLLNCFSCGRYYFRRVDISIYGGDDE